MLTRLFLAGLLLSASATIVSSAPAPRYRAPKKAAPVEALQKLQGTWELAYEANQRFAAAAPIAAARGVVIARSTMRVRIEGTRWSYVRNLRGEERVTTMYELRLDPSKKPMWLDLVRDGAESPTMSGIVSIEGDNVKFCYTSGSSRLKAARPVGFAADDNSRQMIMTLRRVGAP